MRFAVLLIAAACLMGGTLLSAQAQSTAGILEIFGEGP
jgi:hypothetical protein